jgi:hypothetical protein
MTRYPQDRATVVATSLLAIVARCLRDPAVVALVAEMLREEFADIRRQVAAERDPPNGG